MRRYSVSALKKQHYAPKPTADLAPVSGDGKVVTVLPPKIKRMLRTVGGSSHNGDRSAQDSAAITAMLAHGITPEDTYTTFLASPRGKDAAERKSGHLDDYLQRTISKAASYIGKRTITVDFRNSKRPAKREQRWTRLADVPTLDKGHGGHADYLVDKLVPRRCTTVVAGLPSSLKSYSVLKMASCVSQGKPFLGLRCKRAKVLYIDFENQRGEMRWRARQMGADLSRLAYWSKEYDPPKLNEDEPQVLEMVTAACAKGGDVLVVIDPLARASHDCDENSVLDVNQMIAEPCQQLTNAGATVILIHHMRKDGSVYRGSGHILGAFDALINVSRDLRTNHVTLWHERIKYGPEQRLVVKADPAHGTFTRVQSAAPAASSGTADPRVQRIAAIIRNKPGLSQNEIVKRSNMQRTAVVGLLNRHDGMYWRTRVGPRNTKLYEPATCTKGGDE